MQTAKERLFFTADRASLVHEGDASAAFLYAAIGDEIPDSAAQLFGLVDGRLDGGKEKPGGSDKERRGGSDKERKGGSDKGGKEPNDLTRIKGIGAATAKTLAEAGISTVELLAGVDPANPPVMIAGIGEANWAAWVEAAKAPQE